MRLSAINMLALDQYADSGLSMLAEHPRNAGTHAGGRERMREPE